MSRSDVDYERMKLVELAQFVLNRKMEDFRSELYEYLICGTIYHGKREDGLTEQDIHSLMKEIYGLDAPPKLVDSHVEKLVSRKDIIPIQRGDQVTYILSETKLVEISSKDKDYENLRERVVKEFLTRVKASYPDVSESQSNDAKSVFFNIISSIFNRYGSICSDIIAGKRDEIKDIPSLPDIQEISLKSIKGIGNPHLRKAIKDEFRNFFLQPSKDFIYFLYSMAQSYTIAQILNLDPTLVSLEKERFSRKKLFLDTNIIVSLMCVAEEHESVTGTVSLTRDLGIKMVYTPETRREFLNLLKYSKTLYQRIPIHTKSIIKRTEPLMGDPFIRSYWIESMEKRFGWQAFTTRMEGFQEYLKDKFSITVDMTETRGIWADPEYSELEGAVSLADISKPRDVVSHDAFHLLLIKKLRETETVDELGMRSYFLTRDYTLDMAERTRYRGGRIPSHIAIDVWSQMIMPFLSPKVVTDEASDVYLKIMSSKFPSLTKSIDPKDLIDMMGIWMDDPEVTTELLRKTIGSRYLHQHLQKMREKEVIKPRQISKAIGLVLKQIMSTTRKKHEGELSNLKRKYDKEILTLKEQVESLKSIPLQRKKVHKPLFISGILLFVGLVLLAIASCLFPFAPSDVVYWVLGICGTALIASSVFGSEVFERFKKL